CQLHAGLLSEAEQSLSDVLKLLDWLLYHDPQDTDLQGYAGYARLMLGEVRWRSGRPDEALRDYEQARDHWEEVCRGDGRKSDDWCKCTLAWCHSLVANGHAAAGHAVAAARSLRRALALIDEVDEPDQNGLLRSAPALAQAGALIDSGRVPLA